MKKNLLFINGHLHAGGGERSLTDLLRHMDFTKYNVDLLLFEGLGDYMEELPLEVNVIFYDITKTFGSYKACVKKALREKDRFTFILRHVIVLQKGFGAKSLRLARFLFKRLKKHYDCAVAYRPGFCTDFAAFAVKADKKISWWHHGTFHMGQKAAKATSRAYNKMDYVAVVSESCRQLLLKAFPKQAQKFVTVPNIIDCAAIEKKAALYKTEMDTSGKYINLVSVGRLSPEKNMAACPAVCKLLTDRGYPVKWYIIGSGVQKQEIKEKIKEYKLQEAVVLTGSLNNPYPYIKEADFYIHPSLVESQGISVLEALALQKPVVVVSSLGPAEFMQSGENGILTKPAPSDIFAGITAYLEDAGLLQRVKANARAAVEAYLPDAILPLFYSLIEKE